MNDQRRTKVQIYVDILRAIKKSNGRLKKTHVVYKANLTHSRLNGYISTLLAKEFIAEEKERNSTFYLLTERGERFLSNVNKLKGIADAFGIPI